MLVLVEGLENLDDGIPACKLFPEDLGLLVPLPEGIEDDNCSDVALEDFVYRLYIII